MGGATRTAARISASRSAIRHSAGREPARKRARLWRAFLSRRDDYSPRHRATIKGFEILSRDKPAAPVPDLFIRGAGTYAAHINADNPAGTIQSIEHTLRAFDKAAEDERHRIERLEKTLNDYQAQANRAFEHDARLKELLARQAELNAALDLDKSDAQAAEPAAEPVMKTAVASRRTESVMQRLQRNLLPAPQF